jgi:hypothetical protein
MRLKIIFAFALAFCVLFSATGSFGAQDKTLQSPTAFLPETQYAFPRVLEGTEVLHDFIIPAEVVRLSHTRDKSLQAVREK